MYIPFDPTATYFFECAIHEHNISFLICHAGKCMLDKEHLAFTLTLHNVDEPLGIVWPVNICTRRISVILNDNMYTSCLSITMFAVDRNCYLVSTSGMRVSKVLETRIVSKRTTDLENPWIAYVLLHSGNELRCDFNCIRYTKGSVVYRASASTVNSSLRQALVSWCVPYLDAQCNSKGRKGCVIV